MKASKNFLLRNRQNCMQKRFTLHVVEKLLTLNVYTPVTSLYPVVQITTDWTKGNYCFPRERNHNSSINKCTFTKVYRKKALKEQSTLTLAKVICHLSFPCVIRYILSHHQLSLEIDAATIQILLQFLRVSKLLLKSIELWQLRANYYSHLVVFVFSASCC